MLNESEVNKFLLVGANIKRPTVPLYHQQLKRAQKSIYRSCCPFCPEGVLLMKRDMEGHLERNDYCQLCGQSIIYQDVRTGVVNLIYIDLHKAPDGEEPQPADGKKQKRTRKGKKDKSQGGESEQEQGTTGGDSTAERSGPTESGTQGTLS